MNLKKLKLNLPKKWQETSRSGSENQICAWLNHINPLANVDPKISQDQDLTPPGQDDVRTIKVGVPVTQRPIGEFYDSMKAFILSGFAPPQLTLEKLEKLWKGMTKTPGFERLKESDLSADISIAQYQTAQIAEQSFKNMALMPTKGFDVPVPVLGISQIPGLSKNATFTELLESDIYKNIIPKEDLEKLRTEIKDVQKQMPKIRQDFSKKGVKYQERKYLGHRAIYLSFKNPTPKPKTKTTSSSKKNVGGGGGGLMILDPLPKINRPYQKTLISYQAILVKNFVVLGSLLWTVAGLLPGNTPCYSLKQFKRKIRLDEEGIKFIYIVPVVSTYKKEGYLHKEGIEEIFNSIFSALRK